MIKTLELETLPGDEIRRTCRKAILMACDESKLAHVQVAFDFNGVRIVATPTSDADALVQEYHDGLKERAAESARKRAEFEATPEGKAELQALLDAQAKQDAERAAALATIAEKATWRDEPGWQLYVANNSDGYGSCCVRYAETWARLCEGAMAKGATLKDIAESMSHHADTEGITGFMYEYAVSMLSQCWIHGEELRRWHNKSTQIGTEGDEANESGGVLNPALLSIGNTP